MDDITATPQWAALLATPPPPHLAELFASDPGRAERYLLEVGDLRIDYAKQRVDDAVLAALLDVAAAAGVTERRDAMFAGEPINVTEGRPVLHVALRAPQRRDDRARRPRRRRRRPRRARPRRRLRRAGPRRHVDRRDRQAHPHGRQHRHRRLRSRSGDGLPGARRLPPPGADGPVRVQRRRRRHRRRARRSRPAETLFVVSSKTFTTIETLTNARTARDWLIAQLGDGRRRPALRRRQHERRGGRRLRHRHRQHVRVLGVGRRALLRGLGDRPVADDRHRAPITSPSSSPASTPSTSTSAARRPSATHRSCSA